MLRGSKEGTFDRNFRSWVAGLVFTATALAGVVQLAPSAQAAGDGKSAQLSNDLRSLNIANTNAALQSQQKVTGTAKKSMPARVAKKGKKKPVTKVAAQTKKVGQKVKLTAKVKSQTVATKVTKKRKGTKVASASAFVSSGSIKKSLVKKGGKLKGNVSWNAPSGCVPGSLKSVLYQVSQKFGPVVVNSTARGHKHNRRVGGARKSWHLKCMATDFRVRGNSKGLYAFLRRHPSVGGLHRYPSGFFHIDLGPKRTW